MPIQRSGGPEQQQSRKMRSAVRTARKRTIIILGRRTGVALEDAFWDALHDIALATGKRRAYLITQVSKQPRPTNLSSALRLFVLDYYRRQHEQVQEMEVRTSTRSARR